MVNKFLNYLFNYNRHLTKEERKEMIKLTDSATDGGKYNSHDFAVITTDADFWAGASAALKTSEITLKKHLFAFHKAGLVILLGQVCTGNAGRKPLLFADGYYLQWQEGKFRKFSFVINSKEIKEGLRDLPKFLSNN